MLAMVAMMEMTAMMAFGPPSEKKHFEGRRQLPQAGKVRAVDAGERVWGGALCERREARLHPAAGAAVGGEQYNPDPKTRRRQRPDARELK